MLVLPVFFLQKATDNAKTSVRDHADFSNMVERFGQWHKNAEQQVDRAERSRFPDTRSRNKAIRDLEVVAAISCMKLTVRHVIDR